MDPCSEKKWGSQNQNILSKCYLILQKPLIFFGFSSALIILCQQRYINAHTPVYCIVRLANMRQVCDHVINHLCMNEFGLRYFFNLLKEIKITESL